MPSRAPTAHRAGSLQRDAVLLLKAFRELREAMRVQDRSQAACHELTVSQFYAVHHLLDRGPQTLTRLASLLHLDKSTSSRVVTALEGRGYVKRSSHPKDGRSLLLEVTPAGREAHARADRDSLQSTARILADFDPDLRRAFVRLLTRLARATAAEAKDSSSWP